MILYSKIQLIKGKVMLKMIKKGLLFKQSFDFLQLKIDFT